MSKHFWKSFYCFSQKIVETGVYCDDHVVSMRAEEEVFICICVRYVSGWTPTADSRSTDS